jgi:hypothetical protein
VLGALHSFEPDHLAAMATLVGRRSRSRIGDFANGALWGLGHTVTLGSLGAVLVLAGMRPAGGLERLLEAGVALMLVALGIARLRSGIATVTVRSSTSTTICTQAIPAATAWLSTLITAMYRSGSGCCMGWRARAPFSC